MSRISIRFYYIRNSKNMSIMSHKIMWTIILAMILWLVSKPMASFSIPNTSGLVLLQIY